MRADEPSLTARAVALERARLPRPTVPTGDANAAVALGESLFAGDADRYAYAAPVGWVTARTEFFDRTVLDAIGQGIEQIMILGAGYDGRAMHFRTPGVRFFEVDHPATQADKLARLRQLLAGELVFSLPPRAALLRWLNAAGWQVDSVVDSRADGRVGRLLARAVR